VFCVGAFDCCWGSYDKEGASDGYGDKDDIIDKLGGNDREGLAVGCQRDLTGSDLVLRDGSNDTLALHSVLNDTDGAMARHFVRVAVTKMVSSTSWVEVKERAGCSAVQTLRLGSEKPTGSGLVLQTARTITLALHLGSRDTDGAWLGISEG
jgi:hypothetical protein